MTEEELSFSSSSTNSSTGVLRKQKNKRVIQIEEEEIAEEDPRRDVIKKKLDNFLDSDDREIMLQHEINVVNHSERLSKFLKSISDQLGIPQTDDEEEMMKQIQERITALLNKPISAERTASSTSSSKLSSQSIGYLKQNKELLEKRIAELEDETKEAHKLLNIMQKELETSKANFQNKEKEQEQLVDIINKFCIAVGFPQDMEQALQKIQELKEKCIYLEEDRKDQTAEYLISQMQEQQLQALAELQRTIDMQSKLILQYQSQIEQSTRFSVRDDLVQNLCSNLESTNSILQNRIRDMKREAEQIEPTQKSNKKQNKARTPTRPIRRSKFGAEDNTNDEMKHCVWMANTREMLALERRMKKMDNDLFSSDNKMRYMTTENIIQHRKQSMMDNSVPKATVVNYPGTIL